MILKLDNIEYSSNGVHILKGINLEITKGDCISIVGKSGSGKSTLLKIMADLIEVSKGTLIFKEKNYNEYEPMELRRKISYCIQEPQLFGKVVSENLEYPFNIRKVEVNYNLIGNLLEKFNLQKDILDKDILSLSGGEKQRISIIRNLIFTPEVILLDESTSALDGENTKLVENYIEALNSQGVTVIWITHSEKQSKSIFNKRIIIDNGEIERIEVLTNE